MLDNVNMVLSGMLVSLAVASIVMVRKLNVTRKKFEEMKAIYTSFDKQMHTDFVEDGDTATGMCLLRHAQLQNLTTNNGPATVMTLKGKVFDINGRIYEDTPETNFRFIFTQEAHMTEFVSLLVDRQTDMALYMLTNEEEGN